MIENDEVFKILGKVTVLFSTLDYLTTYVIVELVNEEYQKSNKALNDSTTLTRKLEFLQRLNEEDVTNIEVLNRVKNFLNDAILVSKERNRFIHDQWEFNQENLNNDVIRLFKLTGLGVWKFNVENSVNYDLIKLNNLLFRIGALQKKMGEELEYLKAVK